MAVRLDLLIDTNVAWLDQVLALLARIDDRAFSTSPEGFAPHRVGAHLRHVIEFYECFLDGVATGRIDYDSRRRDVAVESSRRAAFKRTLQIIHRMEDLRGFSGGTLHVRLEDAPEEVAESFLPSSIERELQVLSSHTIHHFALIAMTLAAHGVAVERDFGVAPSTLRYYARRAEAA
jgi:hypothetical protein